MTEAEIAQLARLRSLYGAVPVYRGTTEFTGGALAGITHSGLTTVARVVGHVGRPTGGSPYRITSCVQVAA